MPSNLTTREGAAKPSAGAPKVSGTDEQLQGLKSILEAALKSPGSEVGRAENEALLQAVNAELAARAQASAGAEAISNPTPSPSPAARDALVSAPKQPVNLLGGKPLWNELDRADNNLPIFKLPRFPIGG